VVFQNGYRSGSRGFLFGFKSISGPSRASSEPEYSKISDSLFIINLLLLSAAAVLVRSNVATAVDRVLVLL